MTLIDLDVATIEPLEFGLLTEEQWAARYHLEPRDDGSYRHVSTSAPIPPEVYTAPLAREILVRPWESAAAD